MLNNPIRMSLALLFALLVHGALAWWLSQLAPPPKPQPVTLLSMEWLDDLPEQKPTQPDQLTPPPQAQDEQPEPEPILTTKSVAPPPPPKPLPKPPVKQVVKKEPVAEPVAKEAITEAPAPVQQVAAPTNNQESAPQKALVRAQADYLNNPKPTYSRISKRMGEQGEVRLRVQVGASGDVLSVELARSSGFERLDEAAITAVKGWKFKPAMQGEQAVSSWVEVPVKFVLEDE